jgi:hypothetical protein
MRVWLVRIAGAVGVLLTLCALTFLWLHEPLPSAAPSPEADALARQIASSVDTTAWSETGAIEWTFAGRTTHLWDRDRGLLRVRWDTTEVLLNLTTMQGHATVSGAAVPAAERNALSAQAYSRWINDAFWLNPLASLFDEGTTRALVTVGGVEGLLLTYGAGGETPGDSYLWVVGPDGRPTSWRMWVSIIPMGGVACSWEDWQQLPTGAWISTRHRGPFGPALVLSDVRAGASLAELVDGADPFAQIMSP